MPPQIPNIDYMVKGHLTGCGIHGSLVSFFLFLSSIFFCSVFNFSSVISSVLPTLDAPFQRLVFFL